MNQSDRQQEFKNRFGECQRELLAYILASVPRHADALDVLQETATSIWERFEEYDRERPFAAWARKSAHFQICKYREKGRYRDWMLAPFDDALVDALGEEFERHSDVLASRSEALQECLKRLASAEHSLLHEQYWTKTDSATLAASLGISRRQLDRRIQGIRQSLYDCINQHMALQGI